MRGRGRELRGKRDFTQEVRFRRFAEPHAGVVTRAERITSYSWLGSRSWGMATNPELIGAVPKKPTRTPLSLMPLTIVVPTPSGSSIDWKVLVLTVYTNPCVLFELSVYSPTTCPLLFKPKACVPAEAGKWRSSNRPRIRRKPWLTPLASTKNPQTFPELLLPVACALVEPGIFGSVRKRRESSTRIAQTG